MFDSEKFDDVREITEAEMKTLTSLKEHEFLLKVRHNYNNTMTGFMIKLTKTKTVPEAFKSWGRSYSSNGCTTSPIYIIEEKYRRNWKFERLRHGTSCAWAVLIHPYGFTIEINSTAFEEIIDKVTMVNGILVTPCYFDAKLKNAKLLVEKDDGKDFFYSMVNHVTKDDNVAESLMGEFEDIIRAKHPDKVFTFFSND